MTYPQTLDALNTCPPDAFAAALADIWEHAAWVPARVAAQRPFASVDALHSAMVDVVAALDEPARVAFYAGHPELAGADTRRGTMTEASIAEQGTLAMASLDASAAQRWDALNQAYRTRFGFPFILCIRRHTLDSALRAFEERLQHDRRTELAAALDEIAAITRLRLERQLAAPTTPSTGSLAATTSLA